MAFIVEDGTNIPNATSLTTVAFADSYFTDRLNSVWQILTQEEKQACLIDATTYIFLRWGSVLQGLPQYDDQALPFPRTPWPDSVPVGVQQAACEYAVRASTGPLAPDIEQDPSGYQVTRQFERVGPIEERRDFAFFGPGSSRRDLRSYPGADMYMRPFIAGSHGKVIKN